MILTRLRRVVEILQTTNVFFGTFYLLQSRKKIINRGTLFIYLLRTEVNSIHE